VCGTKQISKTKLSEISAAKIDDSAHSRLTIQNFLKTHVLCQCLLAKGFDQAAFEVFLKEPASDQQSI